jgi:RNA polymerase sigma-70 factor (ECF subfamily)
VKEAKMDNKIIDCLWKRDETGISLIQNKYQKYCFTILYRILHNEQDSNECMNDVWLKIWNSIPPAKPDNLSAYIAKIARHTGLNYLKKNTTEKRGGKTTSTNFDEFNELIDNKQGNIDESLLEEVLINNINLFLSKQTKRNRIIFVQRYFYFMEIDEISSVMGINKKTVSTILFRMRNDLKKELLKEDYVI